MEILTFSIFFIILFYFFNRLIKVLDNQIIIPSGAGSLFIFFIIFVIIKNNQIDHSLIAISFFTLIYLIDDIKKLNFILRIFIQLISGFFILYLYLIDNSIDKSVYFIILGMLFMFIFTNLFNFNDGANLHVAFLFLQILISLFLFGDSSSDLFNYYILYLIIFIIIFSFYNHFNLLYFGDSGCFLFSIFILAFLLNSNSLYNLYLFLSVISFYVIDAIYVFLLRIKNKENLLSRNYHYLYQKIQIKYDNYFYLVPGVFLGILSVFFFIKFPNLYTLIIIYLFIGFIYLFIRRVFIYNK